MYKLNHKYKWDILLVVLYFKSNIINKVRGVSNVASVTLGKTGTFWYYLRDLYRDMAGLNCLVLPNCATRKRSLLMFFDWKTLIFKTGSVHLLCRL